MTLFIVNQTLVEPDIPPGTALLDVLRRNLGLTGVKEGCREGDCGACTVLVGERTRDGVRYKTAVSCLLPVGDVHARHVVTIEGLNTSELSPVQQAIVDQGATQCGFCTPGIVIALTGFLLNSPDLSYKDAVACMAGNICRCTGYTSLQRVCKQLTEQLYIDADSGERVQQLVRAGYLPDYFFTIEKRLDAIDPQASVNPGAVRVAGGTDLFVQQPDVLTDKDLEFLTRRPDLQGIRLQDDHIEIGAAVTTEALKTSKVLNRIEGWQNALTLISSTQIRGRATLAGNLINASPIGDLSIMLLALNAELVIQGDNSSRSLKLNQFFRAYKSIDLKPGELITCIRLPLPAPESRFNFEKVSRRRHLDIAGVNSALLITINDGIIAQARLSAGGVAPVPLFLKKSSALLKGQPLSRGTLQAVLAGAADEIDPISDVRGSADYKRRLLGRLIGAHFITCFPDLNTEDLL
ncbi:MAG: FAD binding domain-containing protein [candidate division KSB1 bacterium]|nr:FAD binding domain-containing protein [candidate division KSB1 bacterium]